MPHSSIEIKEAYAQALTDFKNNTPVEQWPAHGRKLSKSGMERLMKQQGFSSFERKRLASSLCKPIWNEMQRQYSCYLEQLGIKHKPLRKIPEKSDTKSKFPESIELTELQKEVNRLNQRVKSLEKKLERENQKVALLNEELEQCSLRQNAIDEYGLVSLRTLHV